MAGSKQSLENKVAERTALLEQALRGQGELLTEVRRAHALLESTFNAISDAIVVTDMRGYITQANGAVHQLFNRAPAEVLGDTCHSLLAEGQSCPHATSVSQAGVSECEMLNRAQDRVLNLRISRVTDPESNAVGFVAILSADMTRERVIERHLACKQSACPWPGRWSLLSRTRSLRR